MSMRPQRFIRTAKFAEQIGVKSASIRTAYWRNGHYCGVKPHKALNGQLLWPEDASQQIIGKAA